MRTRTLSLVLTLTLSSLAVLLGGCPTVDLTNKLCGPSSACPDGQRCDEASSRCVPIEPDGAPDLARDMAASIDGAVDLSIDLALPTDLSRLPNGAACSGANECASGFCVDGVCCDTACDGQCQACDVTPGTCAQVTSGAPHGTRPACTGAGSTCGGHCGTRPDECDYPDGTKSCRDQSCSASVKTSAAVCDGKGACPAPQTTSCGAFICESAVECKSVCANDADCVAPAVCIAGRCQGRLELGERCASNGMCKSGFCVDGFCCNSGCTGQCEACDVTPGSCTQVSGAPHGARTACAGAGTTCGGTCGSKRTACDYPTSTTSCRSASCTSGVQTSAASCDGAGTCPASQVSGCGLYACGATACNTTCTEDRHCAAGLYCNPGGTCKTTKPNGRQCGGPNECTSGFCVDGVCCDKACNGQCEACDDNPGVCTQVRGAPHGTRPRCAGAGTTCGGTCGSRPSACDYPTTKCRDASCANGTQTAEAACDGAGACPAPSTKACAPFTCGPTACKTSCTTDADCQGGLFCNNGACLGTKPNGAMCTASTQCTSGFCVDGFCCDKACGGTCEACDVTPGVCKVVPAGAPHGARTCNGSGTCGGSCNGVSNACSYPIAPCRAASCSGGTETAAASCDGNGFCPAASTRSCAPYVCGANNACRIDCGSDSDCAAGYYCNGNRCLPTKPLGRPCSVANDCTSGYCADGVCCNRACNGSCEACSSSGTCTYVSGSPRSGHPACTTDPSYPVCNGYCSGSSPSCSYPTASCTHCGRIGAYPFFTPAVISASCSAGRCVDGRGTSCGTYQCDPSTVTCRTECTTDADCGAFYACRKINPLTRRGVCE